MQRLLPVMTDQPFFCLPESVGLYESMADHYVDREEGTLNNFSIHLVTAGKGYLEIEGIQHTLHKGDAFLYFPKQQQTYYSSSDHPWSVKWVHFYGSQIRELLVEKGFHRSILWTLRNGEELEPIFIALYNEVETNKILHMSKLSILTYGILTEFMNQAVPLFSHKGIETIDRISTILPLMQEKAYEPFILTEWSERAGVSPYYFCKLFRRATQMTPLAFITLCRIQLSKQWLLEKLDTSIKDIALEAGYPSTSYFNKIFLEREGMTPTAYRRLYLKK